MANHPNWFQLHARNRCIYALHGEALINVICHNAFSQMTIEGHGIVEILPECSIRQDQMIIQRPGTISQSKERFYMPFDKITDFIPHETLLKLHSPPLHDFNPEVVDQLRERLKLGEATSFLGNFRDHTIHHYPTGYHSLGFFAVLLIAGIIL